MTKYNDEFDFRELGKLAIDYSDGVIEAGKGVNEELLEYAKVGNTPLLNYPGEDFAPKYEEFYEKICQ